MKLPFIFAKRFVAAEDLEGTLPVLQQLHKKKLHFTLDLLGEYISDKPLAVKARDLYIGLVETLSAENETHGFDKNISIKLSMLGQKIDEAFCLDNLHMLLTAAKKAGCFIRLDMEGSDITASTLSIFEKVCPHYPENVGVVLQAYLHRTDEDVSRMCSLNARVRLCKGAYKEPESIAYQNMGRIREHYIRYMERLLLNAPYPGIATHDDILIKETRAFAKEYDVKPDQFEFQMLYGMRPNTQFEIAQSGYNMRVYVPFGKLWQAYFTRRLRERKENIWFVLTTLLKH